MAHVELKYGSYRSLLDLAYESSASQTNELVEFQTILSQQNAVSA